MQMEGIAAWSNVSVASNELTVWSPYVIVSLFRLSSLCFLVPPNLFFSSTETFQASQTGSIFEPSNSE